MTGGQAVLLPVGAELYAVPMEWVREVIAEPLLTPLTTAPDRVLGLFNLRGEIVPLFDTAAMLGLGPIGLGPIGLGPVGPGTVGPGTVGPGTVGPGPGPGPNFAAVLQTPQGLVGLAATDLPERASLGTATGPSELPGTAGVFQLGRRVAVMLDLLALFAHDTLRSADRLPATSGSFDPAIAGPG